MKHLFFTLSVVLMISFAGCGSSSDANSAKTGEAENTATATAGAKALNVDLAGSKATWTGFGVGHTHSGNITMKEGVVNVENGNITSGKFMFDMKQINVTDGTEGDKLKSLIGHLSTGFFKTDSFPTSTFEITKVEALTGDANATHTITGNLTLNGITKSLSFPSKVALTGDNLATNATFKFNRTLWNIMENSKNNKLFDLKKFANNAVEDDIEMTLDIKASPATAAN